MTTDEEKWYKINETVPKDDPIRLARRVASATHAGTNQWIVHTMRDGKQAPVRVKRYIYRTDYARASDAKWTNKPIVQGWYKYRGKRVLATLWLVDEGERYRVVWVREMSGSERGFIDHE